MLLNVPEFLSRITARWAIWGIVLILLVVGITNMKMQSQSETAAQKTCKGKIMTEYWAVITPMLTAVASVDSKDVDKLIREINDKGDEITAVELQYLRKWWNCHTQFLSAEDKKPIVDQGRWDEYVNLPVLLSDLLSRYILTEQTDILARYGHRETAAAFRARHPK